MAQVLLSSLFISEEDLKCIIISLLVKDSEAAVFIIKKSSGPNLILQGECVPLQIYLFYLYLQLCVYLQLQMHLSNWFIRPTFLLSSYCVYCNCVSTQKKEE